MHRGGGLIWVFGLLVALPLSAQSSPKSLCAPPSQADSSAEGVADGLFYRPLPAEQRLYHPLSGLEPGSLEVRYLVDGAPHITEAVDLSTVELPRMRVGKAKSRLGLETPLGLAETPDLPESLGEGRMIELLALRPDLVRQLHGLAQGGTRIELEVLQHGELVEAFSFEELLRRSDELRESRLVPVVGRPTVEGPGDRGEPIRSLFAASTYLEDCADCTEATPCETECGYDPWKGGPVTCGEYGVCVPPSCDCERAISERWTDWYRIREFLGSSAACFWAFGGGSQIHRDWWTEWRRDLVRTSRICPDCPSCSNCYDREEVVGYQLGYSYCWTEVGPACSPGSQPCCSELCFVGGLTPCASWC